MADSRARVWTFLVYPESAPVGWISTLESFHVPFCVSPLHEFDKNPTGELKKAHFHVVIAFSGKKSYEQVYDICKSINQPRPEVVNDIRSMVRYLIHRDNPEKFQYDKRLIQAFNGFNFRNYFEFSKEEKYDIIADMLDFIDDNHIVEIATFSQYCRACNREKWWPIYCDYNRLFDVHIRSLRNGFNCIK